MQHTKSRLTSLILSIVMVLGMFSIFPTLMTNAETFGDYTYTILEDGTAEITDYTGAATELEIPTEIEGHKISVIGARAFESTGSNSITIPNGVTSIGDSAFYHCINLTTVTIPDSVTSIGYYNFNSCFTLTEINVNENNPNYCDVDGILFNKEITKILRFPIGRQDTEYTIPNSVTSIDNFVFYDCSNLISIEIPNSVTSIGDSAFRDCFNLSSINIPNGITSINEYTFYGCSELTSIEIPDTVTSIGWSAFEGCEKLTSMTLPISVTTIGDFAFCGCSSITSINIPNNVSLIGDAAFAGCSFTEIVIPSKIRQLKLGTFLDCSNLTSVTISNGVSSIEGGVFSGCDNLTSINIPESISEIYNDAFSNCSSLIAINIDRNNRKYCDVDGVLYNKSKTKLLIYPPGKNGNFSIPDSVTTIGDYAFYRCLTLTSIDIPDNIVSIERMAFGECENLISIMIPNRVNSIDEDTFFLRNENLTIYGYTNSYVETYAAENEIPFVVTEKPKTLSATIKKVTPTSAKIYVERTQGNAKGAISYVLLVGDYADVDFSTAKLADMKNHENFVKAEYSNWTKNVNFNITGLDRNTVYTVVPFTVKMKYGYFGMGENVTFVTSYVSLNTELKTLTADTAKFKISRNGDANGALGYVLLKGDVSDNFKTLEEYQNSENFLANQTSNWTGSVTVTVKGIESGETYTVVPYTQKGNVYTFGLGENLTFTAE